MTPEQRAANAAANEAALEKIRPYLEAGQSTVTHTICGGFTEEHIFSEFDGNYLLGFPTSDTMRLAVSGSASCTVIAPVNVTHIDRCPVDVLEMADMGGGDRPWFPSAVRLGVARATLRSLVRDAGDGRDPVWHDRLAPILADLDAVDGEIVGAGTCRHCGCTDDRACEGGCHWVTPDVCSACVDKDELPF